MKVSGLVIAAVLIVGIAMPVARAAEKSMCVVCQVKHGESEPEEVKAERTYEGVRYTFCSKRCAEEFDTDPVAYAVPKLPRTAPELAVTDLEGKPIDRGDVTLVDFWATWCVPCRKAMPELQALHSKYQSRGFRVIGISIDEDGPEKVRKFVKQKKISYPIAVDGGEQPSWVSFRVKAVPAAFLIDRDGQIVAQWTGKSPDRRELEAKVEELLRAD